MFKAGIYTLFLAVVMAACCKVVLAQVDEAAQDLAGPNAGIGNPLEGSDNDSPSYVKDEALGRLPDRQNLGADISTSELPRHLGGANVLCRPGIEGVENCVASTGRAAAYKSDGVKRRSTALVPQNPRDLIKGAAESTVIGDGVSTDLYGSYHTVLNTAVALTDPAFAAAAANTALVMSNVAGAYIAADENLRLQMASSPEGRLLEKAYSAAFDGATKPHAQVIDEQTAVQLEAVPYGQQADHQNQGIRLQTLDGHPLHDNETQALTAVGGEMDLADLVLASGKVRVVDLLFNRMRVNNLNYIPGYDEPLPTDATLALTRRKEDFRKACGDIEISTYDDSIIEAGQNRTYNQLTVKRVPGVDNLGPSRYYLGYIKNAWDMTFALLERVCAFSNGKMVDPTGQAYLPIPDVSPVAYLYAPENGVLSGAFWKDKKQRDALAALSIPGLNVNRQLIEALFYGKYRKQMMLDLGDNAELKCEPLRTRLPSDSSYFYHATQSGVADGTCDGGECFEAGATPLHREVFTLAMNIGAAHFYGMMQAMLAEVDRLTVPGDIVREYGKELIAQCAGTAEVEQVLAQIAEKTRKWANDSKVAAEDAIAGRAGAAIGGRFSSGTS